MTDLRPSGSVAIDIGSRLELMIAAISCGSPEPVEPTPTPDVPSFAEGETESVLLAYLRSRIGCGVGWNRDPQSLSLSERAYAAKTYWSPENATATAEYPVALDKWDEEWELATDLAWGLEWYDEGFDVLLERLEAIKPPNGLAPAHRLYFGVHDLYLKHNRAGE